MSCHYNRDLLKNYWDKLPPESVINLCTQHAQKCASCKTAFTIYQAFNTTIEDEKRITSNPYLATRIIESIQTNHRPFNLFSLKPIRITIAAATILIVIGFGIGIGQLFISNSPTNKLSDISYFNDNSIEQIDLWLTDQN